MRQLVSVSCATLFSELMTKALEIVHEWFPVIELPAFPVSYVNEWAQALQFAWREDTLLHSMNVEHLCGLIAFKSVRTSLQSPAQTRLHHLNDVVFDSEMPVA